MVGCDVKGCKQWFYTERGLKIHQAKAHKQSSNVPDLIGMGIIKRKLTRKEAKKVTKEVMDMGFENPNTRVMMVMLKAMEVVNSSHK